MEGKGLLRRIDVDHRDKQSGVKKDARERASCVRTARQKASTFI